ncbi:potassium/proton antiporter [Solicola gregarius]|uniref:Potassium/proton antiporter n=1 Tax=Solicola gregarius TaxID=2908642 RepID=A0AA46YM56_9ACTN|nr:potassium/proton antiporter [Solicola gregarius]UYM07695.1 potassium/proton antiporter [Solicola gregarius]
MDIGELDVVLLVVPVVLLGAILAVRLSVRLGLPTLLMYLGIGLVLGDGVVGIEFSDADLAHALGFAALVLILAEGGLSTKWEQIRPSIVLGLLLATVGVVVSVAVVALAAHYLLDLSWQTSVLIGAVTSPTDAAAVFSVLRNVPLKSSVLGTLEAESGLNDAPTVLVVVAVSSGMATEHSPLVLLLLIVFELVAGALVGFLIAKIGAWLLRGAALPSAGLYPLAVLAFAVLAYGSAAALHASGFAAVYIAALVLGNTELPHRRAARSFAEGVGWLAQIGLFVMLGLLATPARLEWWHAAAAIVVGSVLTFLARPLSVVACGVWLRVPWNEQAFLGWAGVRGAVPIVLATIPLAHGVDGANDIFDIVFLFVIMFTFLQGPTLGWSARRLGVSSADEARDVDIDAAPLERVSADMLQIHVPKSSRMVGVEVGELRLPGGASVALVVRSGETVSPDRTMRIRPRDDLLVVVPRRERERVEARLRAIARHGRLAGWRRDG